MGRIQLLSEGLINQIAAGEVVERPASVLKELVENSLDAGARTLRVSILGGGVELLRVEDDGTGMSREDCERCLLRHATSKLRDAEGLLAISTLGFRGEALAAIAAVSRLSLASCEPRSEVGTRIECEGGSKSLVTDVAPVVGTTIEVTDFFFNVPARRKFLRQDATEVRHVEEALVRLALGHQRAAFFLSVDGQPKLSFPLASGVAERLAHWLGPEILPHLLALHDERLGLRVQGLVASPEMTLSNARGIFVFVNGRYIRDRGVNSAIQRALGSALPPGRQPIVALFLEVDPATVDVNVHPQKTEVRFGDARNIHDAIQGALVRAIQKAPWNAPPGGRSDEHTVHYAEAVDRFLSRAAAAAGEGELFRTGAVADGSSVSLSNESVPGFFTGLRHVGTLARQFLLMEGKGGALVVLDSHAAFERVHAATFRVGWGNPDLPRGLGAGNVELPAETCRRLTEAQSLLSRLGIELEAFGGSSLAVRALPPQLMGIEAGPLLERIADALSLLTSANEKGLDGWDTATEVVRVLACEAAHRDSRELGAEEIRRLLHDLEGAAPWAQAMHPKIVALEVHLKSGRSPSPG